MPTALLNRERRNLDAGLVLLAAACLAAPVVAEAQPASTPPDAAPGVASPLERPAWAVSLDVQQLLESQAGALMLERVRRSFPDFDRKAAELSEALGFDVMTGLGRAFVAGEDFEGRSTMLVVDLPEGRGRLEGWLLAMPGYTSEDLPGGELLHQFKVGKRVGGLLPELPRPLRTREGREALGPGAAVTPDRLQRALQKLERVRGKGAADAAEDVRTLKQALERHERHRRQAAGRGRQVSVLVRDAGGDGAVLAAAFDPQILRRFSELPAGRRQAGDVPGGPLATLSVDQIPAAMFHQGRPGSAVFRSVRGLDAELRMEDGLRLSGSLEAASPARAGQLTSLFNSLGPMVGLLSPSDQPLAQTMAQLLDGFSAERAGDASVAFNLNVPEPKLESLIEQLGEVAGSGQRPMRRRPNR